MIQVTVKDSDTAIIIKPKNESNNQRKGGSKNVSSKNKKNTPETGDTWNTELLLTGSLLLLAGIWLFRRKNTKTK
ncbi:LPXTG cell wall anchor domain-containing protein [Listeria immobilis]|uniref:LPXTG cell wall anchor domain-containing protein n=1 Tax=Listeria immobilis TaxID=2713502 RepID=UPI0028937F4D|nr:LPXTG cell wall anchor domain-containing protein [Listeria immobilis]